ncbi:MAG: RNA polymerase factor sigma-32 [bacterium]|nr:RNA polymerase factor sigma-32 [bacterium]MBU1917036.1 RNA polymerase factor sigma-32 [bacterium]
MIKKSKQTKKASHANKSLVPISGQQLSVVRKPSELIPLDPLKRYLIEVSQYPVLSPEEEKEVAKHYREHGDRESAQKLVLSNLRLVAKIASEYKSAFYNVLDLIQEGNLGLMRAVQKYDVDRGVRFSSYAVWWVRAYILKFILDNFRLVKIGTTQAQKKLFFNLMKEKEKVEQMGFVPSAQIISERLDVKEKEVIEMQKRLSSREVELDAPRKGFEGALNMDFVPIPEDSASEQVEQKELKEILLKNLDAFTQGLGEKEKEIFQKRLFAEVPKTLQEIADSYGITRERIRQIETRLISKMRDYFKEKGLNVERSS